MGDLSFRGRSGALDPRPRPAGVSPALLSIAGFAAGHAYQGRKVLSRTALTGAIFTVPVLAAGSLLPSIVAHVTMDLLQGFHSREVLVSLRLAVPPAPTDEAIKPATHGGLNP